MRIYVKGITGAMQKRVPEAQKKLNMQITADCDPLVPFRGGALRNSVRYPNGITGGQIMWDTPYAHYQYVGEVYGPNIPKKDKEGNIIGWWSPPGKKKHPTGRPIEQRTEGTTARWFDAAKTEHLDNWVELVKKVLTKE